jgi:hypothetical protein
VGTVTIVEKPNVLRETSGLMIAEAAEWPPNSPAFVWKKSMSTP